MSNGTPLPSSGSPSGLSLLIDWANEQDHGVRALVARVIETRRQLAAGDIDRVYHLLLREKELEAGDPVSIGPLSQVQVVLEGGNVVRLASLKHVANVNALAPDQEIEFHPRLTVIFGENASGKTGYVRILKRAAAVRTAEQVLPNIYADDTVGPPQAVIGVTVGEEKRLIEWQGEQGVEPLTRLDVFDARSVVVHLAEDLTYSYTPVDLSLFPLVADGIDRVRATLEAAKSARQPGASPFVQRFSRESSFYAKIEGLGASTDLRELEQLSEISPEEEDSLPGLREKVEALRSGSLRTQLESATRQRDLMRETVLAVEALVAFDAAVYSSALSALRKSTATHAKASQEALAGEAVPGVLGETWRQFVEAAESYIRELELDPYPVSGQPCVYCRQPLGDAAVTLVRKYRDYCNDARRQAVNEATQRLEAVTRPIIRLELEELQRRIETSIQALEDPTRPPQAFVSAHGVISDGLALQGRLKKHEETSSLLGLTGASATLRSAADEADHTVADLRTQRELRDRILAEERARLRELEARLALRQLLPEIRRHVEASQWVDRAATQLRRFQGIKKSLTETSKRASEEVLNRDFQRQFEEECKALRAPQVSLDFPGREGEPRRRKLLSLEHGLGDILSEGEQKALALADFLAEASLKPDRSPIVLDDPVTSLDHKRLQYVVDRIVDLSHERQVIVLTHDIWFAAELLARFQGPGDACGSYVVVADSGGVGVAAPGAPRTETFDDRKRRIETITEEARRASGPAQQALVERGYEELRGACEVVVEKELLAGVVERYRPNVKMGNVKRIRPERLAAAIEKVYGVFEKCCRAIPSHSQPLATLGVRPTLEDLEADWQLLQQARSEYSKGVPMPKGSAGVPFRRA